MSRILPSSQNSSVLMLAWKIVSRERNMGLAAEKKKPCRFSQFILNHPKVIKEVTIFLLQVSKICDGRETGKSPIYWELREREPCWRSFLSKFGLKFHRQRVIEPHSKMKTYKKSYSLSLRTCWVYYKPKQWFMLKD